MKNYFFTLTLCLAGFYTQAQRNSVQVMKIYQNTGQTSTHLVQEIDSMRHETITHYELSIQLKDAPQADYAVHQILDFAYVGDSLKVQTAQGTDYYLLSNITNVFYDAQTSTSQLSSDYGVQVANNPLQGNRLDLQYRLRTGATAQLQLFNLSGQLLLQQSIDAQEQSTSIDLSQAQLSAGVYQLVVSAGKERYSVKIVKH